MIVLVILYPLDIDVEVPDDPTSAPLHQSIIINKLSTATNSS